MTRFERLSAYWVYGGTLAGVMLLAMMPALTRGWPLPLTLVLLQLPLYMLHQYEEHDDDSFRIFCNHWIGRDTDVLPAVAVWIINIPFVWGIIAGALYLAEFVHIGYGLIAVYLPIVNAFAHIGAAIALRRYNPGLITAVVLFLPVGLFSAWRIGHECQWWYQILGVCVSVAVHAAIIAYVKLRHSQASNGIQAPKT